MTAVSEWRKSRGVGMSRSTMSLLVVSVALLAVFVAGCSGDSMPTSGPTNPPAATAAPTQAPADTAIVSSDRAVLEALYNATGGDNWYSKHQLAERTRQLENGPASPLTPAVASSSWTSERTS